MFVFSYRAAVRELLPQLELIDGVSGFCHTLYPIIVLYIYYFFLN